MTHHDSLVGQWLTLPDAADLLGTDVGKVRRLVQERRVVAVRRGERNVLSIPADFLRAGADGRREVVPALAGTLTLLADAHLSDAEAITWLFTPDPSLAVLGDDAHPVSTPMDALAAGHKTEIRRRAQAEAF
ncbi:Rv2175c family DNA-binding protein [Cellulomonas bogoriensis]|uniref:Rv2175c family DNA-binding protein n=1 Tax=Cellulomonas bogoriensis TaxID=301388 RepID=UPI0012EB0565|nr:Rv2175c family DNA-binding protein [Cellulomonas bogoriensis]